MKRHLGHLFALVLSAASAVAAEGLAFQDTAGKHLDVTAGGKPLVRYMYAYDPSSPTNLHVTYKPYLHVFDSTGKVITKGPGGQFTHHRGIFIGWSKMSFNGKSFDRWHMKGGEQVHQKFLRQEAAEGKATFTSLVHWNDDAKQEFIVEERTFTVRQQAGGTLIDFSAKLTAPRGDVKLDGDPEHAGIQFRPANEADAKKTRYFYPKEKADLKKDTDLPWIAETFVLDGAAYSVVHMSHPGNPTGTRWSAYRDYGRFGAFPVTEIKQGGSFTFRYQFFVTGGELPDVAAVQKLYNDYAGTQSPTPKLTVFAASQPKPAPAKQPAAPKKPDEKKSN